MYIELMKHHYVYMYVRKLRLAANSIALLSHRNKLKLVGGANYSFNIKRALNNQQIISVMCSTTPDHLPNTGSKILHCKIWTFSTHN